MIQVKFKATFINTEFKVIHEIHFTESQFLKSNNTSQVTNCFPKRCV